MKYLKQIAIIGGAAAFLLIGYALFWLFGINIGQPM